MKRYLALIAGMLLVLAMASGAFAETKFTLGGDALVRGTWQSNYDFNDTQDADKRWWDYRIRLQFDAVADGGTAVRTRLVTTGWKDTWADGGNIPSKGTNEPVSMDYAYIDVPLGKDITATLGKVIVSWGKGFMAWDERAYRFILGTKFGDTTVKIFTQKNYETSPGTNPATGANTSASGTTIVQTPTSNKNLEDNDAYSILAVHKTKNIEIGGIYVYYNNDQPVTTTSGSVFDAYFHGNWNSLTAFGEFSYKGGTAFEQTKANGEKNDQYGGFLHLDYGIGNVKLIGAVAFTKNGYVADDDFTPTFMFGTSQATAMMNFGTGGDTTAGLVAVSYKATKDLTLMGKVALASIDAYKTGEKNIDLTEIDLGLTYQINKSTTYNIDFGYLSPNGATPQDDAAIAFGHRITVNF